MKFNTNDNLYFTDLSFETLTHYQIINKAV